MAENPEPFVIVKESDLRRMIREEVAEFRTSQRERFLNLKIIARRLYTTPQSIREKRCRGTLTLPLVKRDGMLGCPQSVFNQWVRGELQ